MYIGFNTDVTMSVVIMSVLVISMLLTSKKKGIKKHACSIVPLLHGKSVCAVEQVQRSKTVLVAYDDKGDAIYLKKHML